MKLTIHVLRERCQAESDRFRQTGLSDGTHCCELFDYALFQQNEAAWEAIYACFQALVTQWVYRYSRFSSTGEEPQFFMNAAFIRMWKQFSRNSGLVGKFSHLGKYLSYLKMCVHSAIEDHWRKRKKDAIMDALGLEDWDQPGPSTEGEVSNKMMLAQLRAILSEIIQDDLEQIVAEESWEFDLPPRQIQSRHPDKFSSTAEVSQIKRNIIRRLQRDTRTKNIFEGWSKNA